MGTFQDLERAADTLDKLREAGLEDDDITVLSSLPYSHEMLGRPHKTVKLPYISLACAIAGHATCVVSGDRALLRASGYEGVEVLTPRDFVTRFLGE